MNAISAKCGHIKRRLVRNQPLTGKLLEFALDAVGDGRADNRLLDGISEKLRSGTQLDAYEVHVMVDVILLHIRLAALSASRAKDHQAAA